jgi:hypothetical protein
MGVQKDSTGTQLSNQFLKTENTKASGKQQKENHNFKVLEQFTFKMDQNTKE